MATQPQPPRPPSQQPSQQHPLEHEQQHPEERVKTAGEEQLERSEEMEREGIEKWKARHDTRDERDRPRQVPGVSPTETTDGGHSSKR
jgi:hypothetical protein